MAKSRVASFNRNRVAFNVKFRHVKALARLRLIRPPLSFISLADRIGQRIRIPRRVNPTWRGHLSMRAFPIDPTETCLQSEYRSTQVESLH
jgi:hypothetical protein